MIDYDDMPEDPFAEQRAELARIIIKAQQWATYARWTFVVGAGSAIFGTALIVAGALGAFRCTA